MKKPCSTGSTFAFTLLLLTLVDFTATAQPENSKPTLIPWHRGHEIRKMLFSHDGQFLLTHGDDNQVVVTDLKKRLPIYHVGNVNIDILVHPLSPHFYTVSAAKDYFLDPDTIFIQKRSFLHTATEKEFIIPGSVYDSASRKTWRMASPELLVMDFAKDQVIIPFSAYPLQKIFIFKTSGEPVESFSLPENQVNAILVQKDNLLVLTSRALLKKDKDTLITVMTPRGPDNFFANMRLKGDTLVLLSNRELQWVKLPEFRVLRTVSIEAFFTQEDKERGRPGNTRFNHPFEVDEDGNGWLVDTRLSSRIPGVKPENRFYQLARINDEIAYPLIARHDAKPEVYPQIAYHPGTKIFAFLEYFNALTVVLYHKNKGELFRIGHAHTKIEHLYFTKTPGKILLQTSDELDHTGFLLNLANGRIEATEILDKDLTLRYPQQYIDYKRLPEPEWIFNDNEGTYEEAPYLQYDDSYFLNFYFRDPFSLRSRDTLFLKTVNGHFFLSKENGQAQWISPAKKVVRKLQLKTTEGKAIDYSDYFFEKYQYDSLSGLLCVNYGNQRAENGLQYVIDLNTGKLIKQWSFESSVAIFNHGTIYVTEQGVYRMKDDSPIVSFPSDLRPAIFRDRNFVISSDGRFICYVDWSANFVSFDLKMKEGKKMGHLPGMEKMVADPHSPFVYTVSDDGSVRIWNPEEAKPVASIYIRDGVFFQQPSYAILLPDGYYMGENRYFDILTLKEGDQEYPLYQMDAMFNRPDKILAALSYASASIIEPIQKIAEKRAQTGSKKSTNDILITNKNQIPFHTDQQTINVTAKRKGKNDDKRGIMVYVNGTALWSQPRQATTESFETTVDLVDEINHIRICLSDGEGNESAGDYLYVNAKPREEKDLYVIGMGVSQYHDSTRNLKYAEKDMRDLMSYMRMIQSYKNVFRYEIANREVTKEIIPAISDFLKNTRSQDEVILYYAGHGLLDEKQNFYLSTYTMDFGDPARNGLLLDDVVNALGRSAARKKIMLIDACNSGLIDDLRAPSDHFVSYDSSLQVTVEKRGAELETDAAQNLSAIYFTFQNFAVSNGVNILAAAAGNEAALEGGGIKNGLFTYSLITGLKTGEADINSDEVITVSELQLYVSDLVQNLSNGRQRPSFRQANLYMDIPVIETTDSYFRHFIEAVRYNELDFVKIMVENNEVAINQKDPKGFTALHYASRQGYFKMAKYLVEKGADINVPSKPFGFTPAYLAAYNGHARLLYWLISAGADVRALKTGHILEELKTKNDSAVLTVLLNFEAVRERDERHLQWMKALANGDLVKAESLFRQQNLDVNYWYMKAATSALIITLWSKRNDVLKWLIDHHLDVNQTTPDEGVTGLMFAAYQGNIEAMQILLEHGADKRIKDHNGKTALDYAREGGNADAIRLLME